MKLEMSKPFNSKVVKQLLTNEDKFVSEIFSIMPLPSNELVAQNGYDDYDQDNFDTIKEKHIFSTDGKSKRAKTFEELYAKAEELKGKRSNYQDRCLKKNLKNKISKKVKREQRLMQKKLARTERASAETQKVKEDVDVPKIPKQKPIFNSQGNMVFSKFDFSEIGTKKKVQKIEKDPKKILHQLEEKKKKVKELEEVGEKDKAQEIKEKEAWKSVLAKASGEKVKDDPELLKRTIKREEQKKKRSSKKWQARKEKVDKSIQERQQKRSENILKRKKDVKTNKMKKAAKKGRIIPGF